MLDARKPSDPVKHLTSWSSKSRIAMANRFPFLRIPRTRAALVVLAVMTLFLTCDAARTQNSPSSTGISKDSPASTTTRLALGKKLMLKDGSYQLVREYQIEGDRVRYYSLDSSQWEEMPVDLVDWDKTKKIAADEANEQASEISKVKHAESERQAELLDVDASVEIAPKVFLPQGEGLFAFDGKTVLKLAQA